jgi:4-hydroxy-tetrahydrodipicolinate reductase
MPNRIKIILVGLGPIGIETCRLILQKKSLNLLAVVDIDQAKFGKDLSKFIGTRRKLNIPVVNDLKSILKEYHPEVAIITSTSRLENINDDLFECIENKVSVITSCEELLYPYISHPDLSKEIDQKAKENFVHILGTGVNPGFIMDIVPLFFTSVCSNVKTVKAERVVDLNKRRKPLQVKMGLGESRAEFNRLVKEKKLGHVGLLESAQLIADGLRLNISSYKENITPILARTNFSNRYFNIEKGYVCGMKHIVHGFYGRKKLIVLDLQMRIDLNQSYDKIIIDGTPKLNVKVDNGVFGDTATVAMLVNCIPSLLHADFGLLTMRNICIPNYLNPTIS